jgi:hypothetical protein
MAVVLSGTIQIFTFKSCISFLIKVHIKFARLYTFVLDMRKNSNTVVKEQLMSKE